jgi:hypothetical protein
MTDAMPRSDDTRRAFVLKEVQPALLGLMDGSVSTSRRSSPRRG